MSDVQDAAVELLTDTLTLLEKCTVQIPVPAALPIAETTKELFLLHQRLADNTLRITDVAEEAGPDPEESTDVAADGS
jgi:hypothetical protein